MLGASGTGRVGCHLCLAHSKRRKHMKGSLYIYIYIYIYTHCLGTVEFGAFNFEDSTVIRKAVAKGRDD